MTRERIAVTGMGIVCASGHTSEAFAAALEAGRPLEQPIRAFDCTPFSATTGCSVQIDPSEFLDKKGLRTLDRASKLTLVAGSLACKDAGLPAGESSALGISLGCTYAGQSAQGEFDRETLRTGPQAVNPSSFPYTAFNAAAGTLAIRTGAMGPNLTFASGITASHEAVDAAREFIHIGMAEVMLAGGVEALSFDAMNEWSKLGFLGKDGEDRTPFSPASTGKRAGEGACLLVLERESRAKLRGARIHGFIAGAANRLAGSGEALGAALASACRAAVAEAGAGDIGFVSSGANGNRIVDAAELEAIAAVLAGASIPVTSTKAVLGETTSASGALQIASALLALARRKLPMIADAASRSAAVQLVTTAMAPSQGRYVLCTATSPHGSASAVIIEGANDGQ